jgi:hypothetical protein
MRSDAPGYHANVRTIADLRDSPSSRRQTSLYMDLPTPAT